MITQHILNKRKHRVIDARVNVKRGEDARDTFAHFLLNT